MHYKNGREAKNGDKVVLIPSYGAPIVGVLYDAIAGQDYCNGRIAPTQPNDPMPNLKECLHLDDVLKALPAEVPDSSMKHQEITYPCGCKASGSSPDASPLPDYCPDHGKA